MMILRNTILTSLAITISFSQAFAGAIVCDAVLAADSAPTANPRAVTITLDYEPSGTTLKSSVPIGWNQGLLNYKVNYARFNDEFKRNLVIATNPASTHSDLIELTGTSATEKSRMHLSTMRIGQSSVLGEMAKHVTYTLNCNL